jgi:hypothetical protein
MELPAAFVDHSGNRDGGFGARSSAFECRVWEKLRTEWVLCHYEYDDKGPPVRPAYGSTRHRNDNGYEKKRYVFETQQGPEDIRLQVSAEVCLPRCRQERDSCFKAGAAEGDGRLPDCDQVPGCACEVPACRKITHSPVGFQVAAVAVDDIRPLARHVEPDGMAFDA